MTRFYQKNGRIFMEVHPSVQLLHSGLIKDVLKSGGKFVVDMNNGALTIDRPEPVEDLTSFFIPQKQKKYVWWRGRNKQSRTLASEFKVAKIQLADEWGLNGCTGCLYINGQLAIKNLDNRYATWESVIERVAEFY